MPAKSRRKRGKNLPPSKRIKQPTGSKTASVASQLPENPIESAATVKTPVISEKKSTSQVQTTIDRYPFISSELLTIGIFAVVVLAILGILAAIL